jgi:plastocyanin
MRLVSAVKEVVVGQVIRLSLLAGLCGLGTVSQCCAEGWTTIRGRIVYSGGVPEMPSLEITRDADYCGPFELKNHALIVHPENHGLRNVAIFLRNRMPVPVHPSYIKAAQVPVALDNDKCQFSPRMQTLRTGQTWEASSTDTIPHNVAVFAQRNDPFSQIIPRGKPLTKVFAMPESRPVKVECSIHAWMRAYLIITDHPYAAVTDENGEFEIAHVPQGPRIFRFWHERPGYVKSVIHQGTPRKLKSGNWTFDVTGDVLNLGDLIVEAGMFQED